jgi:hypothetical protein
LLHIIGPAGIEDDVHSTSALLVDLTLELLTLQLEDETPGHLTADSSLTSSPMVHVPENPVPGSPSIFSVASLALSPSPEPSMWLTARLPAFATASPARASAPPSARATASPARATAPSPARATTPPWPARASAFTSRPPSGSRAVCSPIACWQPVQAASARSEIVASRARSLPPLNGASLRSEHYAS